jgi:hypothetical protein
MEKFMQSGKQIKDVLIVAVAGWFGLRSVFGYIDPSSGGMLFQILAVAFGLISGLILFFSSRIKMGIARLMRKVRGREDQSDLPAESEVISEQ